jgi:hypothetical protein
MSSESLSCVNTYIGGCHNFVVCVWACVCVHMWVFVCVCMHICVCVHVHVNGLCVCRHAQVITHRVWLYR